jgi:hypothetical protein
MWWPCDARAFGSEIAAVAAAGLLRPWYLRSGPRRRTALAQAGCRLPPLDAAIPDHPCWFARMNWDASLRKKGHTVPATTTDSTTISANRHPRSLQNCDSVCSVAGAGASMRE